MIEGTPSSLSQVSRYPKYLACYVLSLAVRQSAGSHVVSASIGLTVTPTPVCAPVGISPTFHRLHGDNDSCIAHNQHCTASVQLINKHRILHRRKNTLFPLQRKIIKPSERKKTAI